MSLPKYYERIDLPHVVYSMFDAEGTLLYVGMTRSWASRAANHACVQPWWPDVATIRLQHCKDAAAARLLEAIVIQRKRPRYNGMAPDPENLFAAATKTTRSRRQRPKGEALTCPKCNGVKERAAATYCNPCQRIYNMERRRAQGMRPKPLKTVTCPRCGGFKDPGPAYCRPCKKQVDAEYRGRR